MRMFDRKFGERLIDELPATAAVYLFKDGQGAVIYVGKAGNIRRRLQQYRNATRRKVHRKMRDAGTGGERPRDHATGIPSARRCCSRTS